MQDTEVPDMSMAFAIIRSRLVYASTQVAFHEKAEMREAIDLLDAIQQCDARLREALAASKCPQCGKG